MLCLAQLLLVLRVPLAHTRLLTFGSTPNQLFPGPNLCVGASPHTVLNHTLSYTPSSLGVLDQFWTVQPSDVALAELGVRVELSYYFDGEASPSASYLYLERKKKKKDRRVVRTHTVVASQVQPCGNTMYISKHRRITAAAFYFHHNKPSSGLASSRRRTRRGDGWQETCCRHHRARCVTIAFEEEDDHVYSKRRAENIHSSENGAI